MMQMVDGGKFYSERLKQTFSIFRPELEDRLEDIISGAALLADSSCTRDERRERIVSECNAVRMALQVMSYVVTAVHLLHRIKHCSTKTTLIVVSILCWFHVMAAVCIVATFKTGPTRSHEFVQ